MENPSNYHKLYYNETYLSQHSNLYTAFETAYNHWKKLSSAARPLAKYRVAPSKDVYPPMPLINISARRGGTPAPNVPVPAADTTPPSIPFGLSAAPQSDRIVWSFDESYDINDNLATPVGVKEYQLSLDGSPVTIAASSNIIPVPVLQNIGSVSPAPTASQDRLSFTINSAGFGAKLAGDQLTFLFWSITGDFKLSAKVASFLGTGNDYATAGLMIRDSILPGSRGALIGQYLTQSSKGVVAKSRNIADETISVKAAASGDNTAKYLQIERVGNTVTYRYSSTGNNWITLSSETLTLSSSLLIGLFASNSNEFSSTNSTNVVTANFEQAGYTQTARKSYTQMTVSGAVAAVVRSLDNNINYSNYGATVNSGVTSSAFTPVADSVLRAAGYILINDGAGVDPTGSSECSDAVQAQVDAAYTAGKPLWGHQDAVYLVNKTIRFYEWQWDNSTATKAHCVFGAANGVRPKFKLQVGASGFQDSANPRPVVALRHYYNNSFYTGGTEATMPADLNFNAYADVYGSNGQRWYNGWDSAFNNRWSNFDVDISGNPGAVGLDWPCAQNSWINHVKVTATGAYACFGAIGACSVPVVNIEGIGGQYGMLKGSIGNFRVGGGTIVARCKFTGQTVRIFDTEDWTTLIVVGFDCAPASGAEVYRSVAYEGYTNFGGIIAIDGKVTQTSGIVFNNPQSKSIYLRNVYVTGGAALTKMGSNATINGAGTWSRITEYASNDPHASGRTAPYNTASDSSDFDIKHYSIVNGVKSATTQEPISIIDTAVSAPPDNIATQHAPDFFHQIDTGPYVDIRDYGALLSAPELGDTDQFYRYNRAGSTAASSSAIQAAIAAAHAAGHGRVLHPYGTASLDGPINKKSTTKYFGVGPQFSNFKVHPSWVPTLGTPFLITTDDDAEGGAEFHDCRICLPRRYGSGSSGTPYSADRFSGIHWRQGRKSIVAGITIECEYFNVTAASYTRYNLKVSGNGGGRFYQMDGGQLNDCGKDWRCVLLLGTTQPAAFYGINVEGNKRMGDTDPEIPRANLEVNGAQNVRFYGSKREGNAPTLWCIDSLNIAHFSSSKVEQGPNVDYAPIQPWAYLRVQGSCNNIVFAGHYPYPTSGWRSPYNLYDMINNQSVTCPEGLSVYKRGSLNDAAMSFT